MGRGEEPHPEWVSYEPALLPSLARMATEGITVLEEWFRWGEEWSMLLRAYGEMASTSRVLEIGCGQGRVAFGLRYILAAGSYAGFDIDQAPDDAGPGSTIPASSSTTSTAATATHSRRWSRRIRSG